MSVVSMRELLEAGVHFGHQTRRWNPKMKRFIHGERNDIYIIDIQQTIAMLERAYEYVRDTVAQGGTVLFVGTKKQAQEAIETQAQRVGMPYVNYRWLGGMLTNFQTIKGRLARLRELEDMETDGTMELLPKKEVLSLRREYHKLARSLGGFRGLSKPPAALWVVDTVKEEIAVKEANRLNIPVVAAVDTNCDPDDVQYVIPGNDDAIRSVALLTRLIADACADGHAQRASRTTDQFAAEQAAAAGAAAQTPAPAAGAVGEPEPLADWEIALQQEEAAVAAAQATEPAPAPGEDPNRPGRPGQEAEAAAEAEEDVAEAAEDQTVPRTAAEHGPDPDPEGHQGTEEPPTTTQE